MTMMIDPQVIRSSIAAVVSLVGLVLILGTCAAPMTASPVAQAESSPHGGTSPSISVAQAMPKDDALVIEAVLARFFETFEKQGSAAALGSLAGSVAFDTEGLRAPLATLENTEAMGKPWGYELVHVLPIGPSKRMCEIRLLAFHNLAAQAWRFMFYKNKEGAWKLVQMETQGAYIVDFLTMPELEYDSQRAILR